MVFILSLYLQAPLEVGSS